MRIKTVLLNMENPIKRKLIVPFITLIIFLVIDVKSIVVGVQNHENWRIILSSAGAVIMIAFAVIVAIRIRKNIY